ncbi:ATPase associated with various cellular activities, AAA_3 [Sulfurimonas denitrificans DSM 1251]|uniref:ATPase associated with various cellular activities, AAA_3 n=1 Tax=Sulfurimonas denitrificans (strain ATCC 33889 / DSM 1251) TaxID=326298 RepID=Q30PM5_SULDN|nr:MoxR family ATPase [Sulfurimonas denitrificans]ABB45056.1 ATPase associated with various cellular activities, AAA_3 [Sulfurimonas denitrificans DSM 1251]MDD3442185.1 MoxR family ATPase [Sulfurimonas denitrificans]
MRATDLIATIGSLIEQRVPTFLWGAPGIGKSSIIKQIASSRDIGFIDLRLALMDPTDLKGIPFYDKESHTALWAPPAFLPKNGEGVLFLDELNSAPPSVQASAYQLILDRKVGEYELPDGWAIVAAGNRDSDRGVTYRMPSPLANRFVHFEMDVHVEDWRLWAYKSGLDERVISYISYKNEHLFTFDAKSDTKSFATPRSWEYVDSILKANMPKSLLLETISGAVGRDVAVSFLSFIKVIDRLPDINEILETSNGDYSDEVDVLYALSSGLVSAYLRDKSDEKLENLLKYTFDLKSEFAVMIVQDLQRNGITMGHSASFREWVKKFAYLLG